MVMMDPLDHGSPAQWALAHVLLLISLCLILSPAPAEARLSFVSVALDKETEQADQKLRNYLESKTELKLSREDLDYAEAIRRLADWDSTRDGFYVARVTPYVYVSAVMLGAELEPLATYKSKATQQTTYHSYLVVNRKDYGDTRPGLEEVVKHIKEAEEPASFIYHDKFSTSSYFVPSLFFRAHRIFSMKRSTGHMWAVLAKRPATVSSSSELVEWVAEGKADLAAVWDGKKAKFEADRGGLGRQVYFIQLPDILPNDLLVVSTVLGQGVKDKMRRAIGSMPAGQIGVGDFLTWVKIEDAPDARRALANLHQAAAQPPAPVTVEVSEKDGRRVRPELVEAVRQAVRLSSTELVLYDGDYHAHKDYEWLLEPTHDEALVLSSMVHGPELRRQEFQISFKNTEDLIARIVAIVHSRLHRIRYIWPYEQGRPTLLRDVDIPVPAGTRVKVQRVVWKDPERNDFRKGKEFEAEVLSSDFHKITLSETSFPPTNGGGDYFDPMSDIAYRTALERPPHENVLLQLLTVAFVAVLGFAAIGSVVRVRRKPAGEPVQVYSGDSRFERIHETMVEESYRQWREREILPADLLWCDRGRMSACISDVSQLARRPTLARGARTNFPATHAYEHATRSGLFVWKDDWHRRVKRLKAEESTSDWTRARGLLDVLMCGCLLSRFTGRPLEWDIYGAMVAHTLADQLEVRHPANRGDVDLLPRGHARLCEYASKHFAEVIADALRKVSFFRQTWQVTEAGEYYRLTHRQELLAPVQVDVRQEPVHSLVLTSALQRHHCQCGTLAPEGLLDAWLLGQIVGMRSADADGKSCLHLDFQSFAILRG